MLLVELKELLHAVAQKQASDVHLAVGEPPVFRVNGSLVRMDAEGLSTEDVGAAIGTLLPAERKDELEQEGAVDFSVSWSGLGRLRVNVYRQRGTFAVAMRLIPSEIKTLEQLGLPANLTSLCDLPSGLVLVTGPTGSGKSTTLAALVDYINTKYSRHIITLEDPIEIVHQPKAGMVNQREIGVDVATFEGGLRSALRQDPDVILLGEMRDLDTISHALQAAETGHLVLSTLHTADAASTIDRIVSVYPPGQQQQVRVQLANSLQGVISQRLFPRADRPGRVVATETMLVTPAIRNYIRKGETQQLESAIQTGGQLGMKTMVASIRELMQKGLIAPTEFQAYQRYRQEAC